MLAESLLGGTPYAEAMRPTVELLDKAAKKRGSRHFGISLYIARNGTLY